MKIYYLILLSIIIFATQSCYVSRPLKEPKTIKIVTNFSVDKNDYENTKYINNYSTDEYKNKYLSELKVKRFCTSNN